MPRLTIARFDPRRLPPQVWAELAPLASEATTKAEPHDERGHGAHESHGRAAGLVPRPRNRPQPKSRLRARHARSLIAQGCADKASGTQSNYRRILRRVAAAALGPTVYPPRPLPFQQSGPLTPYSSDEEAALVGWRPRAPYGSHLRDGVVAFLGLGLDRSWIARSNAPVLTGLSTMPMA